MSIDDLETRLSNLNTFFDSAPADVDPYALPEPGIYETKLRAVDFFEAKSTGAAFLKLIFDLTDGRSLDLIYNLEPHKVASGPAPSIEQVEQKFSFLKRDLVTLGIDIGAEDFSLASIRPGSPIWDTVLDRSYMIAIRDSKKVNPTTGKPYRNAYLDGAIGRSDLGPTPRIDSRPIPTDTVPF